MEFSFKISVVICTYNREQFLPGLMDSILRQSYDKNSFEIVWIDNNSTDHTATLCQSFIKDHPDYHIRYTVENRQGLSFARNRGIEEAKGEYITFADDDAVLAPDFLEKVCDYLHRNPGIAEVGGPIYLRYLGKIPAWENPYMNSLLGYFHPASHPYLMDKKNRKYPRGSNMTFRTSVFNTCGNFNTALGRVKRSLMGGEEKDVAFRILDAGHKIAYIPEAVVYHLVPESRTTARFIREQATGTGRSEHIRAKANGEYPRRIFVEMLKWGATLILWFCYMLTLKPQKANMLVRFRYWVSRGLLSPVPKE